MTVNDLIKQLQAMPEEDRERVVITCNWGECGCDYEELSCMAGAWYRVREYSECPTPEEIADGSVVIDDSYQRALVLGRDAT